MSKQIGHRTTKAVHVTACDYNESMQLLALALIDKEVKIYTLKQNGTKYQLVEHFSFVLGFASGAAASCLQIERYVTNGRPIICVGTSSSDVGIFYLDDEPQLRAQQGGPTCLRKFCFLDRAMKFEAPDSDDELVQQQQSKRNVRISFRGKERATYPQQPGNAENVNRLNSDYSECYGSISNYFKSQQPESAGKRRRIQSAKRLEPVVDSVQLISDEYWDSVVMNTKDKQEGPDGIQLWNCVFPQLNDYD